MATKTINIKDAYVPELIDVFGEGYQTEILDVDGVTLIPNPQTKTQFANAQFDADIRTYIHRRVKMYRDRAALASSDNTTITE